MESDPVEPGAGGVIGASDLRKLAEAADGFRNADLVVVRRGGQGGQLMVVHTANVLGNDEQLIAVRTDDQTHPADRPNFQVVLQVEGTADRSLRGDFDSIFWSESAIDKFVIPYYARLFNVEKLRAFRNTIRTDMALIGVLHPPGSGNHVFRLVNGAVQDLTVDEYLELP